MSEWVCSKIIKELPSLVGSGTPCINGITFNLRCVFLSHFSGLEIRFCLKFEVLDIFHSSKVSETQFSSQNECPS